MIYTSPSEIKKNREKIILWGGTGQAKIVRPIIEHYGSKVMAVFDDTPNLMPPFTDVPLYCNWDGFCEWAKDYESLADFGFCITIGNPHGRVRLRLHEKLVSEGLRPTMVIHPNAYISPGVVIGSGVQISAGVVIAPEVIIGQQCIINTNASVDHECVLGDGVEVGPGSTLCGNVLMKTNSWIAAGGTVLPRLSVGEDSIVGAGSVLTKDVPSKSIWYGCPAKFVRCV
jgi:sugar O-acyltransferase (sialic acid O-acetyltransferase NeuD family)